MRNKTHMVCISPGSRRSMLQRGFYSTRVHASFQLCACVVFCWPTRWICMWGHITQTCTQTKTFLRGCELTKVRWVAARAVGELAAVCVKRKRETSCTKTTSSAVLLLHATCSSFFGWDINFKAVGCMCCVTHGKEPSALIEKRRGCTCS